MTRLKVSQVKSGIGSKQNQRDTLRTLGLKRIGDVAAHEDRPEIRGMISTVSHLVAVEEVARHGTPHDAEADETDVAHALAPRSGLERTRDVAAVAVDLYGASQPRPASVGPRGLYSQPIQPA